MKILVTGATGFVGSLVTCKLLEAGLQVVCAVKNTELAKGQFPQAEIVYCDFYTDHHVEDWLPKLAAIDVVINCVGIFYNKNKEVLWDVHFRTPKALFQACEQTGVKRIIHLSALGIEDYDTAYAKSKLAAETFLKNESAVPFFILKPSFIYGAEAKGGMVLLRSLAVFPGFIPLPANGTQYFQPIYVHDLVNIMLVLLDKPFAQSKSIACVSEKPMSLKEILNHLALWLGRTKCYFLPIPAFFLNLGGFLGNLFKNPLINSDAVQMLLKGNKASPQQVQDLENITGIKPLGFEKGLQRFSSTEQDKWYAKLFLLQPLLRLSLAFMWLFSAIVSAIFFKEESYQLLSTVNIPAYWQAYFLYGACCINFFIGLSLLFNLKIKSNCIIQIFVIIFYTLIITLFIPFYWLEPFGPIVKNIPILVSILILYAMEP
ncbi:oxidoreductase (plasmid) [Legionella adelaidensis]|uniref:Oxidoreductase n=1 Tax=Legionella adelaidensis TaxID=45056 RepID=A0A0W0R423_9GAMM|nr:SDR family oxidoreductase [Legionella adelaidensis]KTC65828.1 oxidoreductase [Legionella adelaidensis]VEH85258.1 oxidoreductase [Legionella adelaidensis]